MFYFKLLLFFFTLPLICELIFLFSRFFYCSTFWFISILYFYCCWFSCFLLHVSFLFLVLLFLVIFYYFVARRFALILTSLFLFLFQCCFAYSPSTCFLRISNSAYIFNTAQTINSWSLSSIFFVITGINRFIFMIHESSDFKYFLKLSNKTFLLCDN